MKLAYFDCFSGISGNMILGSLIDAGLDISKLKKEIDKLRIKDCGLRIKKIKKQGISAIYFEVAPIVRAQNFAPHNRNLKDIVSIIDRSKLSDSVKSKSKKIFTRLAEAEAKIHGTSINKVHFHEVGAVDAIVDIVGSVVAFDLLGIEKIICSPIPFGRGFINCNHGHLPLPAPAAIELLKGLPTYEVETKAELTTPTGAAIISTLSSGFGTMPGMKINSIGYGAGKLNLDPPAGGPNLLRVLIGEAAARLPRRTNWQGGQAISKEETVCLVETNIDDMNPQIYDYIFEKLFEAGALDVYLTNIQMKKNRPAIKLSALSNKNTLNKIIKLISDETTTLGIRVQEIKRIIADRKTRQVNTKFGKIKIKLGKFSNNSTNISPEFEDVRKAANKYKVPIKKIYEEVLALSAKCEVLKNA